MFDAPILLCEKLSCGGQFAAGFYLEFLLAPLIVLIWGLIPAACLKQLPGGCARVDGTLPLRGPGSASLAALVENATG